jgi:hypothetical protein
MLLWSQDIAAEILHKILLPLWFATAGYLRYLWKAS